jgi:ATP-dependent Clp protease ATP-binding subunit ClpC
MTSNVGAQLIQKETTMGFGAQKPDQSHESMRNKMLEATKEVFKPEFLNRLDDVIVFKSLNKTALENILDLEVAKIEARLKAKTISLELTQKAKDFLIEKGHDPQYGARPMRRSVEKYLEDPMAEEILRGSANQGDTIKVDLENGTLTFSSETTKKSEAIGE